MRLLSEEHNEILKVMDHFGLRDQYMPVKRKGWIHIEANGRDFAFHRKKESRLVNGKFTDSIHYFVRIEGAAQQPVNNFNAVTEMLQEWLSKQS